MVMLRAPRLLPIAIVAGEGEHRSTGAFLIQVDARVARLVAGAQVDEHVLVRALVDQVEDEARARLREGDRAARGVRTIIACWGRWPPMGGSRVVEV